MAWEDELKEFEIVARTAPIGDAEAYGHSLGGDEKELDDDDLKLLEEEIVAELEDADAEDEEELEEDDDDFYV